MLRISVAIFLVFSVFVACEEDVSPERTACDAKVKITREAIETDTGRILDFNIIQGEKSVIIAMLDDAKQLKWLDVSGKEYIKTVDLSGYFKGNYMNMSVVDTSSYIVATDSVFVYSIEDELPEVIDYKSAGYSFYPHPKFGLALFPGQNTVICSALDTAKGIKENIFVAIPLAGGEAKFIDIKIPEIYFENSLGVAIPVCSSTDNFFVCGFEYSPTVEVYDVQQEKVILKTETSGLINQTIPSKYKRREGMKKSEKMDLYMEKTFYFNRNRAFFYDKRSETVVNVFAEAVVPEFIKESGPTFLDMPFGVSKNGKTKSEEYRFPAGMFTVHGIKWSYNADKNELYSVRLLRLGNQKYYEYRTIYLF